MLFIDRISRLKRSRYVLKRKKQLKREAEERRLRGARAEQERSGAPALFFGTPAFAVPTLERLARRPRTHVVASW